MNNYVIKVYSDNFVDTFKITAEDLIKAARIAKAKFAAKYHEFKNIRCTLDVSDIRNHIDEIMSKLHESDK